MLLNSKLSFKTLILIGVLSLFGVALSQQTIKVPTPKPMPSQQQPRSVPLLILTIRSPFAPVLGSDSPNFAFYTDGTVIYERLPKTDTPHYMIAKLDSMQTAMFLETLTGKDELYNLKPYYSPAGALENQPFNEIFIVGTEKQTQQYRFNFISIYGRLDTTVAGGSIDDTTQTPRLLVDLYRKIQRFSNENARSWVPSPIELMVAAVDSEATVEYPSDWPDLTAKTSVERNKERRIYSVYVPARNLGKVQEMIHQSNLWKMGEQSILYLGMRYPFPHEEMGFDPRQFMQMRKEGKIPTSQPQQSAPPPPPPSQK